MVSLSRGFSMAIQGFVLILALTALGCGGTASLDPAPDKLDFIVRAENVCKRDEHGRTAAMEAYADRQPQNWTKATRYKLIQAASLPWIQHEAEDLDALTAPEGEEARIRAIVDGLEEAVAKTKRKPTIVSGPANPFAKVSEMASAYGFAICGTF